MKILFFSVVLTLIYSSSPKASSFDHSEFDALLRKNVNSKGMVTYKGFKNDSFYKYLDKIAKADITKFSKMEKLAFYINAYNALVIKNIIDHHNIHSPLDVDGFFKKIKFKVTGKQITLDELEHQYTLKIDGVLPHFGLVCGAKSCPKILPKAYNGKSVITDLKKNAKEFLANPKKNYFDKSENILYLSEIFNWFKNYFISKHGTIINAVKILSQNKIWQKNLSESTKIKYLNYDWKLNAQ